MFFLEKKALELFCHFPLWAIETQKNKFVKKKSLGLAKKKDFFFEQLSV